MSGEYGFVLFLILLALIPMCAHVGDTSYSDCFDDCIDLNFNKTFNASFDYTYYLNGDRIDPESAKRVCYNECKGSSEKTEVKKE